MQWNEFRSHIGHLSARDQQRVHNAFELGKKMHEGQTRKSGEPYFNHPIAVADKLSDMGADPDTIIAALLHDTIEDTPLTLKEIETTFNGSVGMLIEGVTKLTTADLVERPNLDEQIETLRKMFTLMEKDVRIMVIKLVDRLHNMQTAEFLSPQRQQALAQETQDVFVKIADRLCMKDIRDELDGLALAVLEPEIFGKLSTLLAQTETFGEDVMKNMIRRMRDSQPRAVGELSVHTERKGWRRLREQLEMENAPVTGVSSMTVVFVCRDVDHCYRTLGLLHQFWKREILSFQDFINAPAINGYRGLHTTVILEDGTRVRCKIRTEEMQVYSRKGVTTRCFGGKAFKLMEYFPWAERISTLAQDTEGRSADFWQTLQSDILGESMVIYGPADQSVLIPKGATALDAAFHLFREETLHIGTISVGGKNVPYSTPLQHTNSITVTLEAQPTVKREWLAWVQTGFAMAMIRTALTQGGTEEEKISLGKELLQRHLSDRRKGFIEELDERSLAEGLKTLGYPTLDALYVSIADGRTNPLDAYVAFFEPEKTAKNAADRRSFRISYVIDSSGPGVMDRISDIHRKYREGLTDVRYRRGAGRTFGVTIRGAFSPAEQHALIEELASAGANEFRTYSLFARANVMAGVCALVALWGLDPVFARLLLANDIPAIDLTLIRFLTVWCIATTLLLVQRLFMGKRLRHLNPFHPDLLLCAIALFVTGLSTYLTLTHILPTQYILFIIAGVIAGNFVRHKTAGIIPVLSLIVTAGVLLAVSALEGWSPTGFALAAVSSAGFGTYSHISKRYQEERGFIRARYPEFLFWVATGSLILSMGLFPLTNFSALSNDAIAKAILFSGLFIALPYVLYFEYLRRMNAALLDRTLPFVCLTTIVGDAYMTHSAIPLIGLILPIVFIALFGRKKA